MANWWTKAMFIIFLRNQQIKDRIKFKSFISNFTNITSKVNARFTEILRYQFMYCISNSKNKCFRVTISYDNSNKVIKSFLRWKHFLFLIFWFNYSHTQLATYINCFVPKIRYCLNNLDQFLATLLPLVNIFILWKLYATFF